MIEKKQKCHYEGKCQANRKVLAWQCRHQSSLIYKISQEFIFFPWCLWRAGLWCWQWRWGHRWWWQRSSEECSTQSSCWPPESHPGQMWLSMFGCQWRVEWWHWCSYWDNWQLFLSTQYLSHFIQSLFILLQLILLIKCLPTYFKSKRRF